MISVRFQGKPFNIMAIQVYATTSSAEEMKLRGSMKTTRTSSINAQKKDVLFIIGDCNAKVVKKHLEEQANFALEYRMKQGRG